LDILLNNMFKEEYFKTPFWFEEKLDFLKSLTKTTDKYIKEAKEIKKKRY
jgi:hypothetical protein